MMYLLGDDTNVACTSYEDGESGDPWCITLSIGNVGVTVGSSGRERGACGRGKMRRVRAVLPIYTIRLRRDSRDCVSARIYGMMVDSGVGIDSSIREARSRDDP